MLKNEYLVQTDSAEAEEIAIDYDLGLPLSQIAKKYFVSTTTIRKLLMRMGVYVENEGYLKKRLSVMLGLWNNGATSKEIADVLGVSVEVVNMTIWKHRALGFKYKRGARK